MKKWKTLANPGDPTIWADVSNMWPTGRGSYETADVYASDTSITATSEKDAMVSAWVFNALSATRVYYFGKYLWELDTTLATATDRTGALGADAVANGGHACQYGDITIATRGTGATLISSSGGNFAALAGSPTAKFVCVQSNCLLAFNTSASADMFHASDVGDYTNWTTGEAVSRRLIEHNGPITGVAPWGSDVIVFKEDAVFKLSYVGGQVKWRSEIVWKGIGMPNSAGGGSPVCATSRGLFFPGGASYSTGRQAYYLFDGVSAPRQVNIEVDVGYGVGIPVYDPRLDMVQVTTQYSASGDYGTFIYYYSLNDDAWGKHAELGEGVVFEPLFPIRGDGGAASGITTGGGTPARPLLRGRTTATNQFYKRVASSPSAAAGSSFVQTHKMGVSGPLFAETNGRFGPAAPVLRRRENYSSGSPALALTVDTYTELHDTTAAATASVTESTLRDRFDFTKDAPFCQLKLTATDTDIEIDDISVKIAQAGRV